MFQFKKLILLLIISHFSVIFAQNTGVLNEDKLLSELKQQLRQSDLLIKRGDYYNAIESLNTALKISKNIDDKKSEGVIYTKLGKLQYLVNEPNKAISLLDKAISIQQQINDKVNLGLTYNIVGVIHCYIERYDASLEFYEKALQNFDNPNAEKYIAEINLNEALALIKINDIDKARRKLESAINLSKKHQLFRILSSSYIQNAKVHFSKKNYNLAKKEAQLGLDLAIKHKSKENKNDAYLILSKIHQSTRKYKYANNYLIKHMRLSDSILNIKRESISPEFSAKFLYNYQNAENQQLKNQITETDTETNLARITTVLSIALITILSLLTLSLYKNNNIRSRANNLLQAKNEELIAAKEKAELASKTKANFLSTVTHELRTPLYAVTGLTKLLLDEEPQEKQIPHLKSLQFSGDYLLTFINDILQINKIEANKVELDPEDFNLKIKVENVIAALMNSANDNNTKIHLNYDEKLPETYSGDQLKISQILINLLGNAIKFTKDGDIWVQVRHTNVVKNKYTILFEIKDNGIGISKEKQEQLFESFSQGSVQINRKYGGTGLGLSIVKGLIKILKGKIWFKSQLGKGSVFYFELPMQHVETIKKKVSSDYNKPNIKTLDVENIKILVVEDNKINQMITKKILNKMGFGCEVVDNGEDAVAKVKETKYDVVLMDIHMPGISGVEATKRIRLFNKELTIFALTAVTLEDKVQEFNDAGFNDMISKPFKQETFENKLYEALKDKEKTTI